MSVRDILYWAIAGAVVIAVFAAISPDRGTVTTLEDTLGGEVRISRL